MTPELSVVIPVYNEEAILDTAVRALCSRLDRQAWRYEIILAENGSLDQTVAIARGLAQELSAVQVLHIGAPNYGRALKSGILAARGEWIVCDEIDLGDVGFYSAAHAELKGGADLVVGSKRHPESVDGRPWVRRQGTTAVNALLRLALGFRGTDTHGLKAFWRERLRPVVEACVVEHNLFASELVIRAERAGLTVHELPLKLREIRPPSVGLLRRVPRVVADLGRLFYALRRP
ncbi:MAG: glycosyltransferase family 2 protein [Deltaproteobacteria bacterium]|nr:glycosyltransferase family 2 protein [Deltaproteobacteria bacterium]